MCIPTSEYESLLLRQRSGIPQIQGPGSVGGGEPPSDGVPERDDQGKPIRRRRIPADLKPPQDPSPFAVFGPRIGVEAISGVGPGQQGRRITLSDLKIGLP